MLSLIRGLQHYKSLVWTMSAPRVSFPSPAYPAADCNSQQAGLAPPLGEASEDAEPCPPAEPAADGLAVPGPAHLHCRAGADDHWSQGLLQCSQCNVQNQPVGHIAELTDSYRLAFRHLAVSNWDLGPCVAEACPGEPLSLLPTLICFKKLLVSFLL